MMVFVPGTGMIVHQEMRDGNVPASMALHDDEGPRIITEALAVLPGAITHVTVRSDTAGCQNALITLCNRPGGRPEPLQPNP